MSAELLKLPLILSHTSLNHYLVCPRRFYRMYIAKDAAEKKSSQQFGGIELHNAIKRRLKLREPLPEAYVKYEGVLLGLERLPGDKYVEFQMGIDARGYRCDFGAPVVRFRGIVDYLVVHRTAAYIVDWKSGNKIWEDPLELRTLALLIKARFPDVREIFGSFYWLKHGQSGPNHPVINDTQRTWNDLLRWNDGIAGRIESGDWPADENPLCGWCACSSEQCEFKKERDL